MKKVILVLLTASTLISCSYDQHNVRLRNGNIIKAFDTKDRGYKSGDTVCVEAPYSHGDNWQIVTDETRKDTVYTHEYKRAAGDTGIFIYEYRIGIIK